MNPRIAIITINTGAPATNPKARNRQKSSSLPHVDRAIKKLPSARPLLMIVIYASSEDYRESIRLLVSAINQR